MTRATTTENKHVCLPCCRAEMYAGNVACQWGLVILSIAARCIKVEKDGTGRQTDGRSNERQTVTLRLPLDVRRESKTCN